MIRITIEMVPLGLERLKYPMHVIEISNDGTSENGRYGNYNAIFSRKIPKNRALKLEPGTELSTWKRTRIEKFPRAAKNSYHLLLQALKQVCE